jgi:SAM-dependent methyltransferase
MDPAHLDELVNLEESYWWHVAKRNLVTELLTRHFPPPGRLLEGGIGSARNLIHFRECGYDVAGYDISEDAVLRARSRGLDDVCVHDLTHPWPVEDGSLRAVVLLDVLEHLPNPVDVLRDVARTLRPNGGVVVTVPAIPWLYGNWDRALGHYRRYTGRQLRQQAREAGLCVTSLGYWNSFTLPAAILVRSWQRLFPSLRRAAEFPRVSAFTNRLLIQCSNLERRMSISAGIPIPCGLSVVAVLKRPSNGESDHATTVRPSISCSLDCHQ